MNRAFLIVLVPTAIVAAGYILILRAMGMAPPYFRLIAIAVIFGIGFWWIQKKSQVKKV